MLARYALHSSPSLSTPHFFTPTLLSLPHHQNSHSTVHISRLIVKYTTYNFSSPTRFSFLLSPFPIPDSPFPILHSLPPSLISFSPFIHLHFISFSLPCFFADIFALVSCSRAIYKKYTSELVWNHICEVHKIAFEIPVNNI
jgi:hypothetical protein